MKQSIRRSTKTTRTWYKKILLIIKHEQKQCNGYDTVSRRVFNIFASQADFEVMFETTQSFSLTLLFFV